MPRIALSPGTLLSAATATVAVALGSLIAAPSASGEVGDLILASTSDTGVKGKAMSYEPTMSADGGSVAFYSEARNLDPADRDWNGDVYVKDLATGNVRLA